MESVLDRARSLGHWVDAQTVPRELRARQRRAELEPSAAERLTRFRRVVIPWLHRVRPLPGQRVLEVGCGAGLSTVALAEQGAAVTAVDLSEEVLASARETCRAHGLSAEFVASNGAEIARLGAPGAFAQVIFWACLEHMTVPERLSALSAAWELLGHGGLLTIVETPNRLWYHDSHTSALPFFDWLPTELAFLYSRFSPRADNDFATRYRHPSPEDLVHFQRRGRGVSYHELELALGDLRHLEVVGCLQLDRRRRNPALGLGWRVSRPGRYEALLAEVVPHVPAAFLQPFLYVSIRRN